MDQSVVNLSNTYLNSCMNNFQNQSAIISIFDKDYYGPYTEASTLMYQIMQEKNATVGN